MAEEKLTKGDGETELEVCKADFERCTPAPVVQALAALAAPASQ